MAGCRTLFSLALGLGCLIAVASGCGTSATGAGTVDQQAVAASGGEGQTVSYVEDHADTSTTGACCEAAGEACCQESSSLHERPEYTIESPDVLHVSVKLPSRELEAELRAVNGEHLVSPDGHIHLGERFGIVPAAGLTVEEIRSKVQERLAAEMADCEVTIAVQAQNSRVYYIIVEDGQGAQNVRRMPLTGRETVADALAGANLGDLSGKRVHIARPTAGATEDTILPVDASDFEVPTDNQRLQPGDRIFIAPADSQ